jgi:hypothetical protein
MLAVVLKETAGVNRPHPAQRKLFALDANLE